MTNSSRLLLQIALAFAFLYPAYAIHQDPTAWTGYFPKFINDLGIAQHLLVWGFSIIHGIIALWLLSGWRVFFPSLIAAAFLFSIVYFNANQLDILFRDISLALAALALAFSTRNRY